MSKHEDIFTFVTCCGRFEFTVRKNFLNKCHEPIAWDVYDLNTKYKLADYLHNPSGPAVKDRQSGAVQFFLDGKRVNEEEGKRMSHNYKFNGRVAGVLDDEPGKKT